MKKELKAIAERLADFTTSEIYEMQSEARRIQQQRNKDSCKMLPKKQQQTFVRKLRKVRRTIKVPFHYSGTIECKIDFDGWEPYYESHEFKHKVSKGPFSGDVLSDAMFDLLDYGEERGTMGDTLEEARVELNNLYEEIAEAACQLGCDADTLADQILQEEREQK